MRTKRFSLAVVGLVISLILLVGGGVLSPGSASAEGTVTISLDPATCTVASGGTFTVDIKVDITGSENVDTAQALLNFDPTKLEVLGITRGAAVSAWDTFVSANKWDNVNGTISYFAYTYNNTLVMNHSFVLATIELKASEVTGSTLLNFVTAGAIQTKLWYQGVLIPAEVTNGTVEISEAVISQLAFTTPERTVMAGVVSDVMTIETRNAAGAPVSVTENTTISLSSNSTSGNFYDETGTNQISSVIISSGNSSASFRYKDTTAGTRTITAAGGGWTPATQTVTVIGGTPGTISKIVFITLPQTLEAGQMSAMMTVQTWNATNTPTAVTSNTNITLSSNSTTGKFYDETGTNQISSVIISSGNSSASFRYKDTTAGTRTITAVGGGWTPAIQQVTVNPAPVGTITKIAFITQARTVTAGQVSDVMTIQTQDSSGSAVNVTSNTNITLTSNSTGGKFYSNAAGSIEIHSMTISNGTSSVSFYYKDTKVGTPEITATASEGWTGSQTETVVAGTIKLVFTTPPRIGAQSLTAGVAAVMTIQTQNEYDVVFNVTSDTTINLNSTSPNGKFYSSNATGATPTTWVTISSGTSSVSFYYNDTKMGNWFITADESPSQGWADAIQGADVKAAAASKLVVSGITDPVKAGKACSVTVNAVDAYDNPDTTYAGTINFTSSDGKAILPPNGHTLNNGSYTFVGGVTLKTVGEQQWVRATGTAGGNTITGQQTVKVTGGAGGGGGTNWAAIIGGTIGGLLLIGIIVYLVWRRRRGI